MLEASALIFARHMQQIGTLWSVLGNSVQKLMHKVWLEWLHFLSYHKDCLWDFEWYAKGVEYSNLKENDHRKG